MIRKRTTCPNFDLKKMKIDFPNPLRTALYFSRLKGVFSGSSNLILRHKFVGINKIIFFSEMSVDCDLVFTG